MCLNWLTKDGGMAMFSELRRLFGHDHGVIHSMKRTNGLPEIDNDMLSERVID